MFHLALLCWVVGEFRVVAQSVSDYAVRVSAEVQTNPVQIALSWPADTKATAYTVYRKGRDDSSWGTAITNLAGTASGYTDTNVVMGGAYEYQIRKSASSYSGEGDIYAGIQAPLAEYRGKTILIVDNTFSASLSNELARLQQDLVGDGWMVLRHDVPRMIVDPANTSASVWAARSNELASVKASIMTDYNAYPTNVKAVFLFGHVPVPYSGDLAPDEHVDHVGAWPADAYYANLTSAWTDSFRWDQGASDTRNWNQPGDGKFDPSWLPSDLTLQVGRVDLANLPTFSRSETELLRQYLNKDHNFRHKLTTTQRRGLIDDNFGTAGGEAYAVNGWRNFAPFFGATNTFTSTSWFGTLSTNSYLWGYACGGGTYTSASGVGSTTDFATNDPQVVFTMFFGSYFGDWDSKNNFLRASLGTANYTLTSAWVGRPYWQFHHMALGETVGFSTRVSQNNSSLYSSGLYNYRVHLALMGDPTLRMHTVAPPSMLGVVTNDLGGVDLNWAASPDTVLGYNVYRAPIGAGLFTRLNTDLITGTSFTDPLVGSNVYMVRAVKLEVSGSGSYYNASQGIFQSLDSSFAAPSIALVQPTNNSTFPAPATIQIETSTFDFAGVITNVEFYADDVKIGEDSTPPFRFTWTNVPIGSNSLTARAIYGGGLATNSSAVTVRIRQLLTITAQNTNKVYGAPLPAFTASYSGFVNGDTPTSLDSRPVLSTTANASSAVGSYPINLSGAADGDYYIANVPGTLTITPAATTNLVTSSTNPSLPGQPVTFTSVPGAVPPGAGIPTGTVQFKIDGTNAGAPVSLSSGVARYTNSTLAHGVHMVAAEYAGDGNFLRSTNLLSPGQVIDRAPVVSPYTIERDPSGGTKVSIVTLVSNAFDADGDIIVFAGVDALSANGGIVASNAGWITYTPAPGFTNSDTFNYAVIDGWVAPVTGLVTVLVRTNNGPSPNLSITGPSDGFFSIFGDGVPNRMYRIQSADFMDSTNWQSLGTSLADPFGIFLFSDTNGTPQRFYRSVYP